MGVAQQRALEVRAKSKLGDNISDDELERLLKRHRLSVCFYPFAGRVVEIWHGNVLALKTGQTRAWERWLMGHGLGHHLLHRGNRFLLPTLSLAKMERQADVFAGWLFLAQTWQRMAPWELAEYHCLPEDRIKRWVASVREDSVWSIAG